MTRLLSLLLAAALAAASPAARAQDAAARGLVIAQEAQRRDTGWGDARVAVTMTLQDRRGLTHERQLSLRLLEKPGDAGDKTLSLFEAPADLRGTIFLGHAVVGGEDRLWLYLPALKRVKRVSSANKTGAFFGSEFTYEDIAAAELGKFSYRHVGDRPCGGLTCHVVERYPAYRNSGYRVLVTYIDTREFRPQRIEYVDRNGALLKVLTFSGYRRYAGKFWRAQTMTMRNLKTGRTTVLSYGAYRFRTGLGDADFDPGNLRTIR